MSVETAFLALFLALCTEGALVALFLPERQNPTALAWIGSIASLSILCLGGIVLVSGGTSQIQLWTLPGFGVLQISLNPFSALFLCSLAVVFVAVSIFSAGYLKRYLTHYSLRTFSVLYYGLLVSVVLVVVAGDVLSFLLAWEATAILSYLLVNYEHRKEENIEAAWLMLAMGEAGTLAAAVALLILAKTAGSLDFSALVLAGASVMPRMRWAVFILSFFGFGVKAGIVPFSMWLPRAHPVAPANVSAILSGVILNLGIYGITLVNVRFLPVKLLGPGILALVIGSITALVGILYATAENDMKTMLAHSSIENMGIIVSGLGAGFLFVGLDHPALASIAFAAAFYHLVNHSAYKALLFLGAGTVDMQLGTRNMDYLGGLIKVMPWTGLTFLVGALSISALPPFNGFVSEWLTLQSFLRSVELNSAAIGTVFAFSGALLALTAGLAITCFVKAFAMTFLGMPRWKQAREAVEAGRTMTAPMVGLAVLCLLLGITPTYVIPMLDKALMPLTGESAEKALVPPFLRPTASGQLPAEFVSEFHDLGAQVGKGYLPGNGLVVLHRGSEHNPVVFAMSTTYMIFVLMLLIGITFVVIRLWIARTRNVTRRPRWDGGITRLLPVMTYSATGFSSPVSVIFDALLHPRTVEDTRETVHEHFRTAIRRSRERVHILDWVIFRHLASGADALANLCARMHNGRLNAYVAYVLIALIAVLLLS